MPSPIPLFQASPRSSRLPRSVTIAAGVGGKWRERSWHRRAASFIEAHGARRCIGRLLTSSFRHEACCQGGICGRRLPMAYAARAIIITLPPREYHDHQAQQAVTTDFASAVRHHRYHVKRRFAMLSSRSLPCEQRLITLLSLQLLSLPRVGNID